MSYIRLLQQRIPLVLWVGQVASAAGDRLYSMAILWLALQLTQSAEAMAATAVSESLTLTVVGLLGGPLIDRVNRIKVAISVDVVRAIIVLLIPVAHVMGVLNIWLLMGTGTIMGALDAIFSPAFESMLPSLVGRDEFQALAGLMDTPARFARLFGSGAAGALLGLMPLVGFFFVDSITFGISVLSLILVALWQQKGSAPLARANSEPPHLLHDVTAGFRIVSSDIRMLCIFTADGLGNIAFAAYPLGGLLLATAQLHMGLSGYGYLIAAYGMGSLVGNFVAGNMAIARIRLFLAVGGWFGIGLGFIVLGLSNVIWVALVSVAFAGICGSLAHVSRATLLGLHIPHGDLGKVYSLRNIVETLANALGTGLCGWALDIWSASPVIAWAGVFISIADVIILAILYSSAALYHEQNSARL